MRAKRGSRDYGSILLGSVGESSVKQRVRIQTLLTASIVVANLFGAIVAVAVLSVSAIGAYTVWDAAQAVSDAGVSIGDDDTTLPPAIGEVEGGVNMLIVGTDSCEGANASLSGACQNGDTDGERNDVTMLLHISDNPRRVTVVSFPRDMIVPIPACTGEDGTQYSAMSAQMLNVSYMYGGLACSVATVEQLTGWSGLREGTDTVLGGAEDLFSDGSEAIRDAVPILDPIIDMPQRGVEAVGDLIFG